MLRRILAEANGKTKGHTTQWILGLYIILVGVNSALAPGGITQPDAENMLVAAAAIRVKAWLNRAFPEPAQ
jgi:hypothetical protein